MLHGESNWAKIGRMEINLRGAVMKRAMVFVALTGLAVSGFAGPPVATPTPTGLDRIAAAYPGIWKSETEGYSSEFSQAGSRSYNASRECWKSGDVLKCVTIIDNKIVAELVFTYDQISDTYHEHQILATGSPAEMTLNIKGNTWVYLQDFKDKQGGTVHSRITKVFKSPDSADTQQEFKRDPGDWIMMNKGTETRTSPSP
jgi:hypothetical protein